MEYAPAPNYAVPRSLESRSVAGQSQINEWRTKFSPSVMPAEKVKVQRSFISADQPEVLTVPLPTAVIIRRPYESRDPNRDRTSLSWKGVESLSTVRTYQSAMGVLDKMPVNSRGMI